ncbi:glycosyl transferase family 2, partial [Kingella kingae]
MNRADHWANQHERGHALFLKLTALMVRYLPVPIMRLCTAAVCAYFYATSATQRRHIREYQTRLKQTFPTCRLPEKYSVYQQFAAFGNAITDRFAVWQHKISYPDLVLDDRDNVYADIRNHNACGQIFICSHLGNVEICRALVSHHIGFKMNVLVHSQHAQVFNQALKNAGASDINLIQVSELDAAKMLELANRLDAGEWLAIAADRIPIRGEKTVAVQFLGETAQLPQGAWLLAHLLKAKINTLFVLKKQGRY